MVERGGQSLGIAGGIHQTNLQRRHQRGTKEANQAEVNGSQPWVRRGEVESNKHKANHRQREQDALFQVPVGDATTEPSTNDHADAVSHEHNPHQ